MVALKMTSSYSPAQVAEYLEFIGLDQSFHPSANPVLDLSYLTTLFVHQITAVPYENLLIHYSPDHVVKLDPQVLFTKIVTNRRGRGGYCMENSILFNHMLRALGFDDAYTAGVRIRLRTNGVPAGPYTGFVHVVNVVTLPADRAAPPSPAAAPLQRYALDVGFGGDGPTVPMPLVEDLVHHNSIGTQEIRYVRGFVPTQRFRGEGAARMWIYQYRNAVDKPWNSFYAFSAEFEFMENDFNVVSHFTSQAPESPQSKTLLAIRFFRGEGRVPGEVRVTGKVMLVNGEVKRNVTGKTELVKTCVTEPERVEALKEYFGIELTPEEIESIRGRVPELKGVAA
ncbi:arylamine N-acetyltransferase 2 [Lasiosphaeris hirsuta]|uniref:Arylamine N-acetyltransferase 2 n=1 Tax=Lasiosphaeris hirsuta TaxID=260670 RepID=A0AA40AS17_9PEZI|nr:arylamine N-acetyltransferase 2 [Lasiosphaeris hirsuta]